MNRDFQFWSPAQLAFATGYRIDLRGHSSGIRSAYFIRPGHRERCLSHDRACALLSRLARMRGIDASQPPHDAPRALIDGVEQ